MLKMIYKILDLRLKFAKEVFFFKKKSHFELWCSLNQILRRID